MASIGDSISAVVAPQAVRGLLAPLAPGSTIDQMLTRIRECT